MIIIIIFEEMRGGIVISI